MKLKFCTLLQCFCNTFFSWVNKDTMYRYSVPSMYCRPIISQQQPSRSESFWRTDWQRLQWRTVQRWHSYNVNLNRCKIFKDVHCTLHRELSLDGFANVIDAPLPQCTLWLPGLRSSEHCGAKDCRDHKWILATSFPSRQTQYTTSQRPKLWFWNF